MRVIRDEAELVHAKSILVQMQADASFITESAYRANAELWPKNRISFIDIHLEYLNSHPEISVKDYVSNLRLKLRKT